MYVGWFAEFLRFIYGKKINIMLNTQCIAAIISIYWYINYSMARKLIANYFGNLLIIWVISSSTHVKHLLVLLSYDSK